MYCTRCSGGVSYAPSLGAISELTLDVTKCLNFVRFVIDDLDVENENGNWNLFENRIESDVVVIEDEYDEMPFGKGPCSSVLAPSPIFS